MEPPSPLISWVNPFPSRFINRTACFPRKVSYFCESRMSPWKKWNWMKSNSEARPSTVFLFTIRPFLWFYSRWDLGIIKLKLMNYPTETEHEAMGQRANWGSLKGYLCQCFYLSSYIPHVSMHFEKSRRLSILSTIWNFPIISAKKGQDHDLIFVIFVEWIPSGFRQLSTACKSDDLSSN